MFDMGLIGLGDLTDFLETCDKNEEKLLKKATVAGGRIILRAAKTNCSRFKYSPSYDKKKTYLGTYRAIGNLKKSIKLRVLKPKEHGKQLVLIGPEVGKKSKNDGWYGRLVETEHKTVKGRQRVVYTKTWKYKGEKMYQRWENGDSKTEAHPFMRPAYDENKEKAYQEIARVYNENWGDTIIKDIEDLGDILTDGD